MAKKTGVKKSVKITIAKYLQLHGSEIHRYTQAYKKAEYRDILKTEEDWKMVLKEFME